MGRDVMDDRKRALVLGKFKFLYQDDCEELEILDRFQLAVIQNKLLGPVQYTDKEGKSKEPVNTITTNDQAENTEEIEGFSDPPLDIPGVLDYFVVAWTNPFGQITIDQDIKLFEFKDIQKYSTYNETPKAKAFCQFHSSSNSTELDGFDASIFWSAGLLWKYFKTCGVEKWDLELRELVAHYRNWKEWAHEVHNIPDDKRDKTGKFSANKFAGPASTSSGYRRPKKRDASSSPPPSRRAILENDPPSKKERRSEKSESKKKTGSEAPSTSSTQQISIDTSAPPPGMAVAPTPTQLLPGQPITIPVMGPNGQTFQMQLVLPQTGLGATGPPGGVMTVNLPMTPSTPGGDAQTMYNFAAVNQAGPIHINPAVIATPGLQPQVPVIPGSGQPNLCLPPPNIPSSSSMSSWTSAVNDFLTKKPSPASSKTTKVVTKKKKSNRKVITYKSASPEVKPKKKEKKYKPKAQIEAPSVEDQYNKLLKSSSSGEKAHIGTIKNWHGKFGFLKCDTIEDKIFLHSKDIKEGREMVDEGKRAVFQVLHFKKSVVGAKAINVTVLKD